MNYDTFTSLQSTQQNEVITEKKLTLKRVNSGLEILMFSTGLLLILPTSTLSFWIYFLYFLIREYTAKTYLVKNVATGEKFRVNKQKFKQYKEEVRCTLDSL